MTATSLFPGKPSKDWHDRYVYVKPYALQSATVTVHALGIGRSYWPPACQVAFSQSHDDYILVRRSTLSADALKPCKRCATVRARAVAQ